MKARIIILPGGELSVYTEEGSFDQGKAKIENLLKALKGKGLVVASASPVEQHRHYDVGQKNKVTQEAG